MVSEQEALKMALGSPTLFARYVLNIKPTRYQADLLETEKNSIVLWSRQCVAENEYVYGTSEVIRAGDITEGTETLSGIASNVRKYEDDIYEVGFANGVKVKVSGSHPLWVSKKDIAWDWRTVEELRKGEGWKNGDGWFGFFQSDGEMREVGLKNFKTEVDSLDGAVEKQHWLWKKGWQSSVKKKLNGKFSVRVEQEARCSAVKLISIKKLSRGIVVAYSTTSHEITMACGLKTHNSGKTTTLAIKALHRAITRSKQEILIIAPTQRQAALMFAKIYDYCEFNQFVKAHCKRATLNDVEFDSGSRIHCLPAGHEGTSIRGFSASMIIFDEAAFIPDAVFSAVRPSMAVKGEQIVLSGTPCGRRGYFYSAFHNNEMKAPSLRTWDVFRVKASENPFVEKDYLDDMRQSMTNEQYLQEFEAEFIADNDSFYPYSLIVPAMQDYTYALPMSAPKEGKLVMGVDIARAGSDETAFVICSVTKDGFYRVEWSEQHDKSLITETAGRVIELARLFPDMEIYMDETGLGAGALDIVKERNVSATGLVFSNDMRNKMYSNLKLALEQRRVIFSLEDKKMAGQFANYAGKATSDGKWHIVKGVTGHDDCVDALAMTFCGESDLEWHPFEEGLQLNPFRRMQPSLSSKTTDVNILPTINIS